MARIRSIHPGFFTDEDIVAMSDSAQLLLIALGTEADDQGVFEWKPVRIKIRLRAAWDGDIEALLAEIAANDRVKRFTVDGRDYGAIKNFCKWQRPKAPQTIYPCPSDMCAYVCIPGENDERPERGTALGRILCERQGGICHYCAEPITFYRKKAHSLEIDHRIPISRSGEDDISNLVAACKPCNSLKRSMTEDEFRIKFAVADMVRNRQSRFANGNSQTPKSPKQDAKNALPPPETEIPPQMEDGGWRMEDGEDSKSSVSSETVDRTLRLVSPPPPDPPPKPRATRRQADPDDPEKAVFDLGKQVLGKSSGGQIKKLLRHCEGDCLRTLDLIRVAGGKSSPSEYVGAILRGLEPDKDVLSWTQRLNRDLGI